MYTGITTNEARKELSELKFILLELQNEIIYVLIKNPEFQKFYVSIKISCAEAVKLLTVTYGDIV